MFRGVNLHPLSSILGERRKFVLDQTLNIGTSPARLYEQPVDVRESLYAPSDCVLESLRRIGLGKIHGRLHGRQQVLCPVFGLTSKDGDLRLAPLALGYVAGDL